VNSGGSIHIGLGESKPRGPFSCSGNTHPRNKWRKNLAVTKEKSYTDESEYTSDRFLPWEHTRAARRERKRRASPKPRPVKPYSEIIAELADATGLEDGFRTTYTPSRYEESWLLSSLRSFYDQQLITDVLGQIKGGKEANVYCCEAHPATGATLLAAKVYRPRKFRNLRNDKLYRRGRPVLTAAGRAVKTNEHRIMRAIGKKTAFGVQVMHTSWLMYEYTALQRLHRAGAAVPRPYAAADNAILMGYYGEARRAAPTLNEIDLPKNEIEPLFEEVLRNVELMLQHDLIHGDLSAYNLIYWGGKIVLIDFPQVVDCYGNPKAYDIFRRDIGRVCDYFARQGLQRDPGRITHDLWHRYVEFIPLIEE